MHPCPDCTHKCNCPTGEEGHEFCTHCAEALLGSNEEGSYIDMSSPLPDKADDKADDSEHLEEDDFYLK